MCISITLCATNYEVIVTMLYCYNKHKISYINISPVTAIDEKKLCQRVPSTTVTYSNYSIFPSKKQTKNEVASTRCLKNEAHVP